MTDAFDDEVENTVTIGEYIDDLEQQELEADMVLGGDDGKECTYSQGYVKRQAIFSCLTCVPEGNGGICTACSLACHDGHEVVELWTKRKLRCDCGNSKFGEFYCKLCSDKEPENADNSYNQNFKGTYCTCVRPYPDPMAEEQFEMIQCCICEDWFHENHIGLDTSEEIPVNEEGEALYDELICQGCAHKCSFLKLYPATIWAAPKQLNTPIKGAANGNELGQPVSSEKDSVNGVKTQNEIDLQNAKASCQNLASSPECIIGVDLNAASLPLVEKKPLFLSKSWRNLLCTCVSCMEFYKRRGIDFLVDKEDSIEEYEKVAKQKREEKLQQEEGAQLNFLNGLGHVQKIEILSGINDMKNEIASFMETFDASKSISAEDVQEIFENLKKKKQRLL